MHKTGRKRGAPKTGGRQRGTPNRATAAIKEAAQEYTGMALGVLVEVAENPESPPAARVAASNAILDRGHGKPTLPIAGDDGGPVRIRWAE